MSPKMGSKSEPDISITIPLGTQIRTVCWGYRAKMNIIVGFKLIDYDGNYICQHSWCDAESDINWKCIDLYDGEVLVGFYGYLSQQKGYQEIRNIGLITSKVIRKNEQIKTGYHKDRVKNEIEAREEKIVYKQERQEEERRLH